MAELTERFERFRRQFEAEGFANPQEYLEGLGKEDRLELEILIERFLVEQPPRPWNEAEFEAGGAAEVADRVYAAITSERLKDLRDAAQISRATLVERLAEALGVGGKSERVGFYYHHLELGNLAADGVSQRVFEALSSLLGVGVERVRRAAERAAGTRGGEPLFARSVTGTRPIFDVAEVLHRELPGAPESDDEVDALFTGGPSGIGGDRGQGDK